MIDRSVTFLLNTKTESTFLLNTKTLLTFLLNTKTLLTYVLCETTPILKPLHGQGLVPVRSWCTLKCDRCGAGNHSHIWRR